MVENARPVTIEMFRPRLEDRSPRTNRELAQLMQAFSGRGRFRLHLNLRAGGTLSEVEAQKVDKDVFGLIRSRFYLPLHTDPQEFYMQQQKLAIGVMRYFGELVPELSLGIKDEISLLSDSPSDLFRLLSMPPGNIDRTLAYEVHRHALTTLIAASANARTLNGRLRTLLSRVHHQFNAQLFEGPEGAGSSFTLESIHDDETNEVVGFSDTLRRIPPTAHLKHIPLIVREISGIGSVYTDPRKKDDRVSIVKSVAKALENGGVVNLGRDVEDPIGMMFVLMGGHATPEELADKTVSVIELKFEGVKIVPDDEIGIDHGQSPIIKFIRRKVWFPDVPVPIELIFFDRANYLNSLLEVGERNRENGLFIGRSHDLFVLRRARKTVRVFFPEEIYPSNLDSAFIDRSRSIAQDLRGRYKA